MRNDYEDDLGAYPFDERIEAPARRQKPAAPDKKARDKAGSAHTPYANDFESAMPRKRPPSSARPATGATRPASSAARPATGSARPATGAARPATGSARPATGAARPATSSARPATGAARPASSSARPANVSGRSASIRPRDNYRDYDDELRVRPRPKKRKKRRTSPMVTLTYWLIAVALAFGISYFLHQNVFEIVRVSGDSMYETMMDGDLVVVTKMAYKDQSPKRGDIVAMGVTGRKGVVLRRIVGIPGETIELNGGQTMINGAPLLEQYIGLKNYDNFPAKALPPDKYYVLSDNRAEVTDSRLDEVGLVDRADVIGQARWVVWPLKHMGSL
ncbi:MAG: signal peptidase I [Clostridia bacterium]